ncbi:MAG TPA: CHAT domain-containing protein [Polyangiaceae bacterium]|nr:CHAT domain-containing protein [Polyangiaceae bacterium]
MTTLEPLGLLTRSAMEFEEGRVLPPYDVAICNVGATLKHGRAPEIVRSHPSVDPPRPIVSMGFAGTQHPDRPIARERSLVAGAHYYFWLEIGEPVDDSVTEKDVLLPLEHLPPEVDLDVVLFTHRGGFTVPDMAGRLHVRAGTRIEVTKPVSLPSELPATRRAILQRRLFFALVAPHELGTHHLRCCIYCKGVLVQAHDVSARIEATERRASTPWLASHLDYTLSSRLDPEILNGLGVHRLSVLFSSDGKGTHGFHFVGKDGEVRRTASFDGLEVQDLIERARRAFREVSWGTVEPWRHGDPYLYEEAVLKEQLTADLARLAIAGYRNYDAIVDRLGGADGAEPLAELMRRPGIVQLALKETARFVLPIAVLYDHRLDTDGELGEYSLCEQFARAAGPLEGNPCFLGDCPLRSGEASRVVCPSGFWGFRHELGVPPTLGNANTSPQELPSMLECPAAPTVIVSVSTDPDMQEREAHVQNLKAILAADSFVCTRGRNETLAQLRRGDAHIVYFYGHGGVDRDGAPYMQIGAPNERISRATLRSEKISWKNPRALVFLNGCHTTDLEPERAIDLVSGFVQTARSSGVIGTEITVFEPLATSFAELMMGELSDRRTVGAAMRTARLRLLERNNPLGLLYIAYAMATLRLSPIHA